MNYELDSSSNISKQIYDFFFKSIELIDIHANLSVHLY